MLSWIRYIFRRRTKSTFEKLEEIEKSIHHLESLRTSSLDSERRFIFRLFLYSFILFGILFLVIYYYYWPSTQTGKVILWTSLLIYPSIVSGLKWGFHAFFLHSISKADGKLKSLREEKQQLLEDVMETETFNKAQQILKRFDPLLFAQLTLMEKDPLHTSTTPFKPTVPHSTRKSRRSGDGDKSSVSNQAHAQPMDMRGANGIEPPTPAKQVSRNQPPLLRPILPRERSFVDKLLDVLVGDGPDKRYALICNECASHNGMALKEEFEFLAFRCCYCSHFNPPRRVRQMTPIPPNIAPAPHRTVSPAPSEVDLSEICSPNHTPVSSDSLCRSSSSTRVPNPDRIETPDLDEQTPSEQTVVADS